MLGLVVNIKEPRTLKRVRVRVNPGVSGSLQAPFTRNNFYFVQVFLPCSFLLKKDERRKTTFINKKKKEDLYLRYKKSTLLAHAPYHEQTLECYLI